jgi:hypothetical protein
MVKLKGRGSDGRVAIYTGSSDAPFDTPLSNLSSVKFHSDLSYPTIINTVTSSITLPARSANTFTSTTHTLFAHGRPGIPMLLAELTSPFASSLSGTVPVFMSAAGFARLITIGANSANVVLHEQCVAHKNTAQTAVSVTVKVNILDVLL